MVLRDSSHYTLMLCLHHNKEWHSGVILGLYSNNGQLLMYQPEENSKFEFPINQVTIVGLNPNQNVALSELLLDNISVARGLKLRIEYKANIFADAWKIEAVKLRLKFIDQTGLPYSVTITNVRLDGNDTINCNNANQILDGFNRRVMEYYINGNFSPTTSTVKKN